MLRAHIIGFFEKNTVNRLSRVAPIADKMDANDFKFSWSPYAIESAGSSVTSRVQRNSPQRCSPEREEGAHTPILEGPGEAQHAGSPPQPRTSPQTEGDAGGAGVNQFGTNVVVLERWHPSPIDLTRPEANPNWEDIETDTHWDNQQRNQPEPANVEEEGFQETHCSPPGASRCESHPDVEIVSSAPSQPVVPIVELSSDDKMEKPHESNDDDEEESGPFVQTETKPLKLPSGVVIKVEKDH